jgi:cardiolipin synthase
MSALLVLQIGACASLPDYLVLKEHAEGNAPTPVQGSRGALSERGSARVVERLQTDGDDNLLDYHLEFVQRLGDAPLVLGNNARLLIDGPAAHSAMFDAIARARDHVNIQTYIIEADEVGERLAALLERKHSEGVGVNLMYDSLGSRSVPPEFFKRLRSAGIAVCEFNPVNPLKSGRAALNHRGHRKVLIVDGALAYTGGINISAVYSTSSFASRDKPAADDGWRDTQIEIAGPAVTEFQKLFFQSWEAQRCPAYTEKNYFPAPQRSGDKVVRVLASTPADPVNLIYAELLSAITHARRSIHITMAYFVPDPQMIDALKDAVARGVEVKLVLPGVSDAWIALHAGRSHYRDLLAAGVQIFERKDALLHAKTAVIDGVWSTVGSANMDWRSFLHNDELNAVVLGASFGAEMESMFKRDLDASTPVSMEAWSRRGPGLRMRELFARLWEYFL